LGGGRVGLQRHEFLRVFKEQGSEHIRRMFIEMAESQGMDWKAIDNVQFSMLVNDNNLSSWKSKSHFTKMFHNEVLKAVKKGLLNIEELGFVTLLATYMDYQDNMLKHKNGEYISQKDMVQLTGYSKRKVINMLNKLKTNQIIYDHEDVNDKRKKMYSLDPNLFFKGKEIDVELKKIYNSK
jgi:hypothetical protein